MDENNRARSSSPRRIMKRGSDSIITSVQDVGAAGDGPSGIKKVNVMGGSGQGLGLKRADIEAGNYKMHSPRIERQEIEGGVEQSPGGFSSILNWGASQNRVAPMGDEGANKVNILAREADLGRDLRSVGDGFATGQSLQS